MAAHERGSGFILLCCLVAPVLGLIVLLGRASSIDPFFDNATSPVLCSLVLVHLCMNCVRYVHEPIRDDEMAIYWFCLVPGMGRPRSVHSEYSRRR